MSVERTNIQRDPTYQKASWNQFVPYGFTSETEPYPYGIHKLRENDQSKIHKSINLENESLVGYGPIVISILEDDATVLLSLLHTLDYFFRSDEQKDFLSGSAVYTVWATCPEDLKRMHESLVHDLNREGYRNENINFLNIFDNSTNHRRKKNEPEIGQEIKTRKSGGREALEYIHKYLLSTDSSATLVQTFNTDNDTRQKYQDSLDELAIEAGTGSQHKIHNVELDDNSKLLPLAWNTKDASSITRFLNGLWNEKKIPFFGKLINQEALRDLNMVNEPLLRVIEAFRNLVKDKTPSTKYNQVIHIQKADTAAA